MEHATIGVATRACAVVQQGVAPDGAQAHSLALIQRHPSQIDKLLGTDVVEMSVCVLCPRPVAVACQVEPIADDDVRQVVIVHVADGGHARGVHRRAHHVRLGVALRNRVLGQVARLVPYLARLRVPAAHHAAGVRVGVPFGARRVRRRDVVRVVSVLEQVQWRRRLQQVVVARAALKYQVGAEAHDLGKARVGHVEVRSKVRVDACTGRLWPLPVVVVVGARVLVQRAPRVLARL